MKKLFKTHALFTPLATLSSVDVNVITFGEYEQIEVEHSGKNEAFNDALITAATGLNQTEIESLSMPDFNSIENCVLDLVNKSSDYFCELDGISFNKDKPALLDPLQHVAEIEYKVPSVKVSRIADTIQNTVKEPFKYPRYLTKACTGLSDEDINALSVRDWNMLQARISSFLQEPAGYFQ